MRHSRTALAFAAILGPVFACQVEASYPQPVVQAQVDVQPPPPPQVDVNAQVQPVDPNAQAQTDPNAPQGDVQDNDPAALTDFRDALSPYGQWMDDPQYGTIWVPSPAVVGVDFQPYQTAGHWVYDNDYTWVSDYDWGWAPFHYGRWTTLGPGRGWGWIPGKEYAGAWVTWRNGDDGYGAVGWAPTPPAYYWRGGAAIVLQTPWYQPNYNYVETSNLFAPSIGVRIIRDPGRVREYEARTRVYAPAERGYATTGGGVRMRVRGPAPTRFGLQPANLPRPPANNPGLQRAQQYARTPVRPVSGQANVGMQGHTVTQAHTQVNEHAVQQPQQHLQQPEPHTVQQTHVEPIHNNPPPPQHITPAPTVSQRRPPAPQNVGHSHH